MSITAQIINLNNNINNIKEIKKEIKNTINNDFDIINNEQIENYSQLIENGLELYKNYIPSIKTEQVTEITVNDAMKYNKNKLELFGNTEQQKYQGYNLIALSKEGLEISHAYNGNYQSSTLTTKKYTSLPAGTYTLVFKLKSNNNGKFNKVQLRSPSNTDIVVYTLYRTIPTEYTQYIKTFTISEDTEIKSIFTQNAEGSDTFTFKDIMILSGTYTIDTIPTYEIYVGEQPSPNSEYPQDIHTVTGENIIELNSKNFYNATKNKITTRGLT